MSSQPSSEHTPVVREASTYLTDSEAAALCTVFADGLESGMGYGRIIELLERQDYSKTAVKRLRTAIHEEGDMLGEALARFGLLDPTARKLVLVAEQQGTLPDTFRDLATHYKERHDHRKQLLLSFVEPGILMALGLVVALNLVTSDLRAIAESTDVWDELKPIFLQSLFEIGIFGCLVLLMAMAYLHLPVDMKLRNAARRLWLSLPLGLNRASRLAAIGAFFRYIQQSISSGLTVHRGLELAAEASNYPSIERSIAQAQRAIEEGETLTFALRQCKAIPPEAIDYVEVGEESGNLEERLCALGDRYHDQAQESFERTMSGFLYVLRMVIIVIVIGALLIALSGLFADGLDPDGDDDPPPEYRQHHEED